MERDGNALETVGKALETVGNHWKIIGIYMEQELLRNPWWVNWGYMRSADFQNMACT